MAHEVVFDSKKTEKGELIGLASGYISLTEIKFLNENIVVCIESKTGEIEFCDLDANILLTTKVELPDGDEKYSDVECNVTDKTIKLGFPRYSYKDNYPNCDGEHDRWTKTISGFDYLVYDFVKNSIV